MAPLLFNSLWLLCVGCHLATSVSGDGDTAGDDLGREPYPYPCS
jgi:hypothetical protein